MVSVTQVLEYFTEAELLAWYLREGKAKSERITQEALRIGTEVDQRIRAELLHQDTLPAHDPAVLNCLHAWDAFKQEHPQFVGTITGIQTELTDGEEVVGHPDLEITESARWGIVDIKTSKAIQPKHLTQVVAYLHLKTVQDGLTVPPFVAILRLDKVTGQYEYREVS